MITIDLTPAAAEQTAVAPVRACVVCGKPSPDAPECIACVIAFDAWAARRGDL